MCRSGYTLFINSLIKKQELIADLIINATTRPTVAPCKLYSHSLIVCIVWVDLFRLSNFENRTTESKVSITFGSQIPLTPQKLHIFSKNIPFFEHILKKSVFFSDVKPKTFKKKKGKTAKMFAHPWALLAAHGILWQSAHYILTDWFDLDFLVTDQ